MPDDPLQTPVQFVPGVGPGRAKLLEKLRLRTAEDLLWYLPRDALDLTEVTAVRDLESDKIQTVRGIVVDCNVRELSHGRRMTVVLLDCDGQHVRGTWFNQTWVLKKFHEGETVLFSGKPKRRGGRWELSHPRIQWIEDDEQAVHAGVLPRYGLTDGLKMHDMRRITRKAAEKFSHLVPEYLPKQFRTEHNLPHITDAIMQVHRPKSMDQFDAGTHRIIFDDLLEFQLGLAMRRRAWKAFESSPCMPTSTKVDARIRRLFSFDFTEGQNQAVREISADLASGRSMHRLLQADVGAGKTAIGIYAILVAIAAGYQAVLMAPTELLALQHWQTIEEILTHSQVQRILLTGNLTSAQRITALADIQSGNVQLIVGTQAVIQEDVKFSKLGLAVIDEQQKFGVMQRAQFAAIDRLKSDDVDRPRQLPHVLVMTATPIPRSLCLTQFGDLDITTVKQLPPGRQRVVTSRVFDAALRSRAWQFVRDRLREGRQVYVVCPRVGEESVDVVDDLVGSAEEVFSRLTAGELREFRVGLVHGQMDRQRRAKEMESFRKGETQVIVCTTVVEVGVDVPNATLMIIQQAERFGLSQLHQLRGRISRGIFQGYCLLFSEAATEDAVKRLEALEASTDGFKIAEADFELRGPGDILGTRQHGQLPLRVAHLLRDQNVLIKARKSALRLIESGEFDDSEFVPLKIRVLDRFGQMMELSKSG